MRNVPQYVWKSTACVIDVMCFWCSLLTAVRGGAAISDVLMMQLPITLRYESIMPSCYPIISPHLQAAQQDATEDMSNNVVLVRRPNMKQLLHQAAQRGATARSKTAPGFN